MHHLKRIINPNSPKSKSKSKSSSAKRPLSSTLNSEAEVRHYVPEKISRSMSQIRITDKDASSAPTPTTPSNDPNASDSDEVEEIGNKSKSTPKPIISTDESSESDEEAIAAKKAPAKKAPAKRAPAKKKPDAAKKAPAKKAPAKKAPAKKGVTTRGGANQ